MTPEQKKWIDDASYESLLTNWRFHQVGSPSFEGECGEYYKKVMTQKREEIGNDRAAQISKDIGWERS